MLLHNILNIFKSILMVLMVLTSLHSSEDKDSLTAKSLSLYYSEYKISQENIVESKILKPRVINFSNYLFLAVLEIDMPEKDKLLSYSAVLSLLGMKNKSLEIPDKYAELQHIILKETKLIINAQEKSLSPLFNQEIDYKQFKIPKRYKNMSEYYRVMKFIEIMPLDINLSSQIEETINESQRLKNLYNAIYTNLNHLKGSIKPKEIEEYLFHIPEYLEYKTLSEKSYKQIYLNSGYDYDIEIVKALIDAKYSKEAKEYYKLMKRDISYNKSVKLNKNITKVNPNLINILNIMIEDSLTFSHTVINNKIDLEIIKRLKRFREIAKEQR